MERNSPRTQQTPQRPARLQPLHAATHDRADRSPALRHATPTPAMTSGLSTRLSARGQTPPTPFGCGVPTRQSKPLGRGRAVRPDAQLPSVSLAADNQTSLTADQVVSLTSSFHQFHTPAEEAYAVAHQLPGLFTRLVHDLSLAQPVQARDGDDSRGSEQTWIREWFAHELATSTDAGATSCETLITAPGAASAPPFCTPPRRRPPPPLAAPRVSTSLAGPSRSTHTQPRGDSTLAPHDEQGVSALVPPSTRDKPTKLPTTSYAERAPKGGGALERQRRGPVESLPADQSTSAQALSPS